MPTVVVVLPTQTYRATDFIRAGEQLGVDLIVASEAPPPFDMGDRYVEIDCGDPDAAADTIITLGDRVSIDGVVAADDGGVVVAALAGAKLGLAANDPEAARATRDKALQRDLLARAEVPQPRYFTLGEDTPPEDAARHVGYPLVVKPLDRSAGQGVIMVDGPEGLDPAITRVKAILEDVNAPARALLIESYLSGEEVAVEGLIGPDGLTTLAIFDKPEPLPGPGFQETILVTPSRHSRQTQAECLRVAEATVTALGLSHGPVHVELMIVGDQVYVIEAAARSIGGLCSRSLSFGLMGTTLESLILRNALGRDKPELRRAHSASGVLMIPIPKPGILEEIGGVEAVRRIEGVRAVDITAQPGEALAPPPEGSRYIGFVFARADRPADVVEALRQAMTTIQVRMR